MEAGDVVEIEGSLRFGECVHRASSQMDGGMEK